MKKLISDELTVESFNVDDTVLEVGTMFAAGEGTKGTLECPCKPPTDAA